MQKLALVLLFGSLALGAMMPSTPPASEPASQREPEAARTLAPSPAENSREPADLGGGSVVLERSSDGHFYAEAQVNGMPVEFLVDTGASAIALSRDDAHSAFVPTDPTMDEVIGSGASGPVKGQVVRLGRVSLGPLEVEDVPAAVLAGGKQSLLGQSFLSQFNSVTIQGDRMVLR